MNTKNTVKISKNCSYYLLLALVCHSLLYGTVYVISGGCN